MKLMTSAAATTSKAPSAKGSACASPTRKSTRRATGWRRAWSICALDGSTADTMAGAHRSTTSSVKTPVPQPTSSQRAPEGGATQSRNAGATARLQRPIARS
jgi:hypothetical protein